MSSKYPQHHTKSESTATEDMCVLDFSKAFDCLDIPIMLDSLYRSGIRGKALKWIESWCRGNKFRVKHSERIHAKGLSVCHNLNILWQEPGLNWGPSD